MVDSKEYLYFFAPIVAIILFAVLMIWRVQSPSAECKASGGTPKMEETAVWIDGFPYPNYIFKECLK